MSGNSDLDLQILMHDWQAPAAPPAPADQIRRYVQRRSRLLIAWAAFDLLVGSAFLVFLLHRAVTDPDPIEKLAMGLLAAIAAGRWPSAGGIGGARCARPRKHPDLRRPLGGAIAPLRAEHPRVVGGAAGASGGLHALGEPTGCTAMAEHRRARRRSSRGDSWP